MSKLKIKKSKLENKQCPKFFENCPYFISKDKRKESICDYEKRNKVLCEKYEKMYESYRRAGQKFEEMRETLEENLTKANEIIALLNYTWGY